MHKIHGTEFNLRRIFIDQRPGAIHFSGHGITAEEIRAENVRMKSFTAQSDESIDEVYNRGHALVMENNRCLGQYLYESDLKKIIKDSETKLDFVFMATCHSEFAAKIFLKAGATHVIGVNQN